VRRHESRCLNQSAAVRSKGESETLPNTECSLHFSYSVQSRSSLPDTKEKRAKARKEAAVLSRVFAAISKASETVSIKKRGLHYRRAALYLPRRSQRLMKLAKLLDLYASGSFAPQSNIQKSKTVAYSRKCQTSTATTAEPGDLPFLIRRQEGSRRRLPRSRSLPGPL
jgi:hypothetical protein